MFFFTQRAKLFFNEWLLLISLTALVFFIFGDDEPLLEFSD